MSAHVLCPHCRAVNRVELERPEAPRCGACHRELFEGPVELTPGALESHLAKDEIPLVVDFWAAWCGPCKMMAPQFERAARMLAPRARFAKVDTEAHPGLAARYAIRGIPTTIVFRGGREVARQSGAMGAADIAAFVERSGSA
jgi:thioredoxin 2